MNESNEAVALLNAIEQATETLTKIAAGQLLFDQEHDSVMRVTLLQCALQAASVLLEHDRLMPGSLVPEELSMPPLRDASGAIVPRNAQGFGEL